MKKNHMLIQKNGSYKHSLIVFMLIAIFLLNSCSESTCENTLCEDDNTLEAVEDKQYSSDYFYKNYYSTSKEDKRTEGNFFHAINQQDETPLMYKIRYGISVRDKNDETIFSTDEYGFTFLSENGIVYTQNCVNAVDNSPYIDFFYYDNNTKSSHALGRIDNVYYVASYDFACYHNLVFVQLSVGDSLETNTESLICIIDTSLSCIQTVSLGKNTLPYTSLTILDDDVYCYTAEDNNTYVWKYNHSSGEIKKVMVFSFDTDLMSGDYLLHLSSDEDHLFLLHGKMLSEDNVRLFLEKYDRTLQLDSSLDISDEIYNSDITVYPPEWKNDELRQPVFGFDAREDVIYYQNRSITRTILKTQSAEGSVHMETVINLDPDSSFALYPDAGRSDCCYYRQRTSDIYFFDYQTYTTKKQRLVINGIPILPCGMQYNSNGKALVTKSFDNYEQGIKQILYYVDLSDLEE